MTVAKNTNHAKQAIAKAYDIRCFSLSNNFSGAPLAEKPVIWGGPVLQGRFTKLVEVTQSEFLARELEVELHAKLTTRGGKYTLHIHSNLWYEFAA